MTDHEWDEKSSSVNLIDPSINALSPSRPCHLVDLRRWHLVAYDRIAKHCCWPLHLRPVLGFKFNLLKLNSPLGVDDARVLVNEGPGLVNRD